MKQFLFTFLISLIFLTSQAQNQSFSKTTGDTIRTIVILGSSTAAGTGPTSPDSAWVNRFKKYVAGYDPSAKIYNLAVGGFTTYDIMPTGYIPPVNRPTPKVNNNITKALTYNPDVIIINMPSNDANNSYPVKDQLKNYSVFDSVCASRSIALWVTTTQPRNFGDATRRKLLIDMKDSTFARYGDHAIDFWTDIANADGTIAAKYNSGDGIHLNNAAHRVLVSRVISAGVWSYLFPVSVEENESSPERFSLKQNYPNPFNPETVCRFTIPSAGIAEISIFNIAGQKVYSSNLNRTVPGEVEFTFNGKNLPSGIYLLKVSFAGISKTVKMMLLK